MIWACVSDLRTKIHIGKTNIRFNKGSFHVRHIGNHFMEGICKPAQYPKVVINLSYDYMKNMIDYSTLYWYDKVFLTK